MQRLCCIDAYLRVRSYLGCQVGVVCRQFKQPALPQILSVRPGEPYGLLLFPFSGPAELIALHGGKCGHVWSECGASELGEIGADVGCVQNGLQIRQFIELLEGIALLLTENAYFNKVVYDTSEIVRAM